MKKKKNTGITFYNPVKVKSTLPISQMVVAGDFMYTWGYGALFDKKNPRPGMKKVFEHVRALLAEKNLTFRDVVKTTVLLAPLAYFDEYSKLYAEYFKPPHPCRTTIPVINDRCFLEIDIVAYKKGLSD